MEILLSNEQQSSLEKNVYELLSHSINKAREDSGINQKQYMRKKELCLYLSMSNNTVDKLILDGLPQINVRGLIRYSKDQVDKFMLEHNK